MSIQSFRSTGMISIEELRKLKLIPPEERLKKGPVVIVECPEKIPCNICVDACPQNAITIKNINELPEIDWNKCTGCGTCVAYCPGLAIFVVDISKPNKAYVTVPHEFLPVPKLGDEVTVLSRDGTKLGKGKVVKIFERNRTWVITVEVPREFAMEVRAIWVEK
ncbi:MAG: ferredoxin [Thermoprotei archaeon]|nr:MAG: ferredoxin [Thermoprotei archaeon]